jgi:hypothetical protein
MVVAALPLVVAGCTSGKSGKEAAKPAPPKVTVSPAANTKDVPISAEIGATVTGGKITGYSLTDDKGAKVAGALRPDGSSWLPSKALNNKQTYTAEVTATSDKGLTSTQKSSFTTMPKPAKQLTSHLYFDNDRTYGVAMPVTLAFEPGIPKEARAAVQRRLFVNTDPPQPGAWHWIEDGTQAYYRAPDFWRSDTKISVRAALCRPAAASSATPTGARPPRSATRSPWRSTTPPSRCRSSRTTSWPARSRSASASRARRPRAARW